MNEIIKIKCQTCKHQIGIVFLGSIIYPDIDVDPAKTALADFFNERFGGFLIPDKTKTKICYLEEKGILSMRKRFDGQWGVQCICGATSIIAEQEKGLLKKSTKVGTLRDGRPSVKDIKTIFDNIKKNPTKIKNGNGYEEIDGFRLEKESI